MPMNKRKVAIFVDDFSATGVVINAVGIARELQARGAEVQFVATQASGTLLCRIPSGVSVTQLLPRSSDLSTRRDRLRASIKPYRRFLKEFGPGVIFSAGNQGHLLTLLASIGQRSLQVVIRISNDIEHGSKKGRRRVVSPWRLLKFRWVAARADRLVFVSRQLLQNWAGIRNGDSKTTVIPNGVDVEAIRRQAEEGCGHPWLNEASIPVVVGIGRLTDQKNFSTLIQAVAIASQVRPMRLLLIGTGPRREALLREAQAAGLSHAVDVIPPVDNPMPYMALASAVALPSWWEGASNVLLEALACETPVVASWTAGSAEEVLDGGRYGILVDPSDADQIAKALLKQTGSKPIRPAGRARDFSMASTLHSYADLILAAA